MSIFHPATSSTISTTRLFIYISCSRQDKNQRLSWHHSSHSLGILWWTPSQHGELSGSFYLPNTLSCTRATKETSQFWGCGQFLPFTIKRILGIKRIFPCSFENKRMCLLTRVYGNGIIIVYLTTYQYWHNCILCTVNSCYYFISYKSGRESFKS